MQTIVFGESESGENQKVRWTERDKRERRGPRGAERAERKKTNAAG